jgi:hypothetical protein
MGSSVQRVYPTCPNNGQVHLCKRALPEVGNGVGGQGGVTRARQGYYVRRVWRLDSGYR